jgi:hypothetical protein
VNNEEIQKMLQKPFREAELQRRAMRTQIIKNHIDLTDDMNDDEKLRFHKALTPDPRGYWRKLWDAIRGK